MRSRIWPVWVLTVAVVGCGPKKVTAPKDTAINLGGKHATYRSWKADTGCAADPSLLRAEFDGINGLLTDYLAQTSMGADGTWTDEQIALLDASQRELPAALDTISSSVTAMSSCKFEKWTGVTDAKQAAGELVDQARKRVAEAPTLVPLLKEKIVLMKWKSEQPAAITTGKEQWCGGGKPKPGTVPDIFYAASDETGVTEYLFCDDVKVVAPADAAAKPEAKSPDPKKKLSNAKLYVEAAAKYPASEVSRPPKPGDAEKKPDDAPKADESKPAEEKKPEG